MEAKEEKKLVQHSEAVAWAIWPSPNVKVVCYLAINCF
jgi:hypothetical protein